MQLIVSKGTDRLHIFTAINLDLGTINSQFQLLGTKEVSKHNEITNITIDNQLHANVTGMDTKHSPNNY